MLDEFVMLAVTDSIWSRLIACCIFCGVGVLNIIAGLHNVKTQTAEESGKRRAVNNLMGNSNTYVGGKAVTMGRIRIGTGILAIIFGIVAIFTGPFLPS